MRLPALNVRLVIRVVIALVVAFALWYAVRAPYGEFVARRGGDVLAAMSGMPADEIIGEVDGKIVLDTGLVTESGRPVDPIPLAVDEVHWNLALFFCVLFVVPWWVLRRRWLYVGVAAVLMIASHVMHFTAMTFGLIAQLHDTYGLPFIVERDTSSIIVAGAQAYSLIFDKALPLLLAIPLLLTWRKGRPAPAAPEVPQVGRNEPCPCGSGRKYKKCCGAVTRSR